MFAENFKNLAKINTNFRKVLHTGKHSQVVAMSLPINGDIGEETHETIDQIFLVIEGTAQAKVNGELQVLEEHDLLFVPAGALHNITNTDSKALKLITIYSPPAHPDGTVHPTKRDALAAEY